MINVPISKEDVSKLNVLARGDGAQAMEHLADLLYDYFTHEMVNADGNPILRHQGAAQLAEWLKLLPKAIQSTYERSQST